jgi:superkiller protein 3
MTKNDWKDEEVLRELASDLIKARQWLKACLVIQQIVAINPENALIHSTLGYVYLELNELEKAEECFLVSINKGGESIDVLLSMAKLRSYQGEYSGQLEFALRAAKWDDEKPEAALLVADAHIRLGHSEEAEKILTNIIHVHRESSEARLLLAKMYLSSQRIDDATRELQTAVSQDKNDASLWAYLGHVLSRQKNLEDALRAFQNALQLEPENSVYAYNLGDIYLALGKPEKAIGLLNKCVQRDPEYSIGYYDLGLAYFKLKRYEECITASTAALRDDPDMLSQRTNLGIGAITNLGLAYMNSGNYTEAENCFRRNLKLTASTFFNLGLALFRQKRYDESLVYFQFAHQIKPDDPEYLDLIGNAYLEISRLDHALEALDNAIAADDTYALAHYDKGVVLARMKGEDAAAIKSFQRALGLNADLYWAYYGIGCVYALQGNKKRAIELLDQALQKGFRDFPHLEKDDDWQTLKEDSQFQELISRYTPDL